MAKSEILNYIFLVIFSANLFEIVVTVSFNNKSVYRKTYYRSAQISNTYLQQKKAVANATEKVKIWMCF